MLCGAVTTKGRPCTRRVPAGAQRCAYHARQVHKVVRGAVPAAQHPPPLPPTLALDGVGAELALLRVLARKLVGVGDVTSARLVINTIGRLVKLRHKLAALEPPERP